MSAEPTFSLDTVAVLVQALEARGVTVGSSHFKLMSQLHGSRGEHGFGHDFRKAKARAREIANMTFPASGSASTGQAATPKAAAKSKPKTTKKRGNDEVNSPAQAGDEESAGVEEKPAKKRATPKKSPKKEDAGDDAGFKVDPIFS